MIASPFYTYLRIHFTNRNTFMTFCLSVFLHTFRLVVMNTWYRKFIFFRGKLRVNLVNGDVILKSKCQASRSRGTKNVKGVFAPIKTYTISDRFYIYRRIHFASGNTSFYDICLFLKSFFVYVSKTPEKSARHFSIQFGIPMVFHTSCCTLTNIWGLSLKCFR